MSEEVLYHINDDAEELIRALSDRYPEYLSGVREADIVVVNVFGTEPKQRGFPKFGNITQNKDPMWSILKQRGQSIDFVIEMYEDVITNHSTTEPEEREKLYKLVLLHQLYKIEWDAEKGVFRLRQHDVHDFKWMLDQFGDFIRTGTAQGGLKDPLI